MSRCRICNGKLIKIIDFGKIALVGNFFKKKKRLKKYNISLHFCNKCRHVQIFETLNPDLLFKNYLWETGISETNLSLIHNLVSQLKKFKIHKKSKVLEIASNDGSFLKKIKKRFSCKVIGVDPAKNLKSITRKNKVFTIFDYFNFSLSKKIKKKYRLFDFIFGRNVIAHVSNPNHIFKGVNNLLDKNGIFVIEVPHLMNIYSQNQYDNIFHEHVGFHTLKSIMDLSEKNYLKVFNVEKINSQGGSIRCFICKKESFRKISKNIKTLLYEEKKNGLFNSKKLKLFKKKISSHIAKMKQLIKKLKQSKKIISVYGASGKGQALLQYCQLDNKLIDYAFDKSKLKQGCFTPGTNIKIKNPLEIKKSKTNYLLLLSWNIKDEIIKQEKKFLNDGGKFIIPFPSPRIITK